VIPHPVDWFTESPLILSFSAQARPGVLASFAAAPASGCGRGEGTLELAAADRSSVLSPLGERDRVRGSFAAALNETP
jgi:hypothetical protein